MTIQASHLRRLLAGTAAAALLLALGACAGDPTIESVRASAADPGGREGSTAAILRVAASTAAAGDYASAAGLYRRAHDLEPRSIEPLLGLGRSFTAVGALDEAAGAYKAALAIDADNVEALRGYGNTLLALDQPRAAITQFEAVLGRADDAKTYNAMGLAHDMLGDHKAAQACYRTGLNGDPSNLSLRNNLGLSLALSGDFRESIEVLRAAATAPGAGARQRLNLAMAYGLAGDTEQATRVARMDLDEQAVRSNLAFYRMLRTLKDPKAIMQAIGAYAGGARPDLAQAR